MTFYTLSVRMTGVKFQLLYCFKTCTLSSCVCANGAILYSMTIRHDYTSSPARQHRLTFLRVNPLNATDRSCGTSRSRQYATDRVVSGRWSVVWYIGQTKLVWLFCQPKTSNKVHPKQLVLWREEYSRPGKHDSKRWQSLNWSYGSSV